MASSPRPERVTQGIPTLLVVLAAIVLLALAAYAPVFNNYFISDDFFYLTQARLVAGDAHHLLFIPPGLYRVTQYLFITACYKLFGDFAPAYYAASLLLHVLNCLLVYGFVSWLLRKTAVREARQIGAAAAIFFAVYERHHEAVMWISAANELIASAAVIATVWLWGGWLAARSRAWCYYALALLTFAFALFSKESSVAAAALLPALEWLVLPRRVRAPAIRLLAYAPLAVAAVLYLHAVSRTQSLVTHGLYAVSPHFFVIYARSLTTLILFVALAAAVWTALSGWASLRALVSGLAPVLRFFLAWLLITPVPFCLATYLNQMPSRQFYLPSVGTAALVGVLAGTMLAGARGEQAGQAGRLLEKDAPTRRRLAIAACALVVLGNVAYVWKKDKQFEKRSAPTYVLLQVLNAQAPPDAGRVYVISGSEYYQVIARSALAMFTSRADADLIFVKPGDAGSLSPRPRDYVLQWDGRTEQLRVLRYPH